MSKILVNTKKLTYDQWLNYRKGSIGGSDSSVILGLNPWKSQYTLWADKKGLISCTKDNEAMRVGRDLEDYVAVRFCEATGKKVKRRNYMFLHDDFDFISANVDREVIGENAGLECKTTNVFTKSDFECGEIPLYYYCQCMHYMAVMGYEKMYLAVLVLGKAFYWFEIERNENEIQSLITTEAEWWSRYIINNNIPEADGSYSTSKTLDELYPNSNGEVIYINDLKNEIDTYIGLGYRIKESENLRDTAKQKIQFVMGNAEKGSTDNHIVSWKNQVNSRIDTKKLKAELPNIYNLYKNDRK